MADIDEAGVKFVVQGLDAYLRDIDKANDETKGIGTKTEGAASKSQISWKKIGGAASIAAAVVTAAVSVIGGTMLKLAGSFDDAYDSIQVKTGATGKDLEGLKTSIKNVMTSIPPDGGDIAKAMGAIYQKTGATGLPLETLTAQILELSRITGTDLDTNLEAVLGATQRWGLSAETAAPFLDELFRISQESGVPVADLAVSLADNKAILDQMGLTLPGSAELIGALGKAGIDADTAFGGLRVAITKMLKDGVTDPKAELDAYFQRIKDAPSDAEAAAIGTEIFGKQSLALSQAIRDGTFDMDTFTAAVGDNKNGIIDTAEQTNDWKEKLDILKNKLLVEVEPALMAIFDAVTEGVEQAGPKIEEFRLWFTENVVPAIEKAVAVFKEDWLPAIQRIGETLEDFWNDIGKPVFDHITEAVLHLATIFGEVAKTIGALIDGDWSGALEHFKEIWVGAFEFIKGMISGYAEVIKGVVLFVFGKIVEAADEVFGDLVRGIAEWMQQRVIDPITSFGTAIYQAGDALFGDLFRGMADKVADFASLGADIVTAVINGLAAAWGSVLEWIKDHLPTPSDLLPDWLPGGGMPAPPRRPWSPSDNPVDWTDPNRPIMPTINPDRSPFLPPDRRPRRPGDVKQQPKPATEIDIDAITDPAQFLALVMNAIATIEALADADVPNIARPKLKRLAMNLRNIIVEFGQAMKGVSREASENAAVFAGFLEPVLRAVQEGVAAIDAIEGATPLAVPKIKRVLHRIGVIAEEFLRIGRGMDPKVIAGVAEMIGEISNAVEAGAKATTAVAESKPADEAKIKATVASIGMIARESMIVFAKMDATTAEKTALVSGYVADIVENVRRAADALLRDGGPTGGGGGPIDDAGVPGAIGGAADKFAAILAGIVAGLPARGSTLQGAPGGITYNVSAVYQSAQNPSSIRLDLIEMAMRAAA